MKEWIYEYFWNFSTHFSRKTCLWSWRWSHSFALHVASPRDRLWGLCYNSLIPFFQTSKEISIGWTWLDRINSAAAQRQVRENSRQCCAIEGAAIGNIGIPNWILDLSLNWKRRSWNVTNFRVCMSEVMFDLGHVHPIHWWWGCWGPWSPILRYLRAV